MKRILSCVLVLILLFTSVSTTAVLALAAEAPTISFNSVEAETGDTVSLQLSINNNPGIAGLAVSLKYDTTALTLTETKKGTLFSGFTAAKNFAWDESADVTADGVLATFTFAVSAAATPGDYDIEVIVRSCTNEDLYDVNCNVQNGKVTVKAKPVPATGVSLDKETLSLDTGANNTATLIATVSPDTCTNKAVNWNSSDETVATVNNGIVTAVKKGTATITVTTVDGGFTDVCTVTVACAHTEKTSTPAKTANCQEGGWDAYYTCDGCGQLFAADGTTKISAIPTTGKNESIHTNIQPFVADTATCLHQGHDAYKKCVDCGVVTEGSDTKYYGDHNYGALILAVAEKHTTDELSPAVAAHYQCSVCDKYFTEAKVETTLAALTGTTPSHSYGNWVTTDADQHWKECGCGNKIQVDDHNYYNTCDTTCNICGHIRTINHSYSTTWSDDGTNHWHECTVCGDKKDLGAHTGGTATCKTKKVCDTCSKSYGDFGACDYVETVDAKYLKSAATCVAEAVYYKSCSVCGTAHTTETFKYGTVNASNHVGGTYVEGQRETDCVNPGYTGDVKCNSCRQVVTPGTDIPRGDHVPASVWSNDATHHWKECKTVGCGNLIDKAEHSGGTASCVNKAACATCHVEYGTVNANNHVGETEIKGAVPASCDQPGYTGDTWCKDCNTKIKDGEVIPAGHKTTEVPASPATHESAGNIKYYTCSGCSLLFADAEAKAEIKAEDTIVAKGEHNYGEWVNTDAESHWKECACGNKIEAATHTYGEWTVTKEATTAEKGSKEKTCSVCGHKVTEEIPAVSVDNNDTNNETDTDADVDNSKDKNDTAEKSPQTGDNSNVFLWIVLLMISACSLVAMIVIRKKKAE